MLKHGKWKCVYTLVDSGQTNKLSINSTITRQEYLNADVWSYRREATEEIINEAVL